jgi:hypothetical protein
MLLLVSFDTGTKKRLDGKWVETWGIGVETDVDYLDTLSIKVSKNKIRIRSLTEEFKYTAIQFDGEVLKFRINRTDSDFFVDYNLRYNGQYCFEGPVKNSDGLYDRVKLEKIR